MVWPSSSSEVILFSSLPEFGTSSLCQPICAAFGLQAHSFSWAAAPAFHEAALAVVCVCIWLGRYPKACLGSRQESIRSWCAQFCAALLKTSELFTSRTSYKYCVLFLVSPYLKHLECTGSTCFPECAFHQLIGAGRLRADTGLPHSCWNAAGI